MKNYLIQKGEILQINSYVTKGLFAGPIDKYIERSGPFEDDIANVMDKLHELLIREGKFLTTDSVPVTINDGCIGGPRINNQYILKNCLIEQQFSGFDDWYYVFSIVGQQKDVSLCNACIVDLASHKYFSVDIFKHSPNITKFKLIDDLDLRTISSVSSLEEKFKNQEIKK